jgi:hypothetical protein
MTWTHLLMLYVGVTTIVRGTLPLRELPVAPRLNDEVWPAGDLRERLERRDKFFVLDVRNRDEFERFRLEGCRRVLPLNGRYLLERLHEN